MPGTIHEDPRVLGFLGASLSEQLATLRHWGLAPAGVLLVMNACENRCFFCANEGVLNPPPSMITRFERASEWLEKNRVLGVRRLCIVGTEPALHADFERLLARAREVGFSEIEVMTSGLQLAVPGRAERWAELGVATIAAPLYAASAEVHDAIVGRTAFARTIDGLDAAKRAGIEVRVHTLALSRNLSSLSALSFFVRGRFGTRLSIAPVRPKESLFDYEREAPDLVAIEETVAPIDDVALVGFPRCVARNTRREAALSIDLYFRGQVTGFIESCEPCVDRAACPGIVAAEIGRARVRPRLLA